MRSRNFVPLTFAHPSSPTPGDSCLGLGMETALHFPPYWPSLQVPQLSSRRRKGSLKPQKAAAEEKSTHIYPNIMSQLL